MPKITDDMIHPELQKKARSLRRGSQQFSLRKTKLMKVMCKMLHGRHSKKMKYKQEYLILPDGSKLRICVYTPLERKGNVPGILWIHGGGYAIGAPEQDDTDILRFVSASGCIVVSPDYTLSLDKSYPATLNDCYLALLWLHDNGPNYGMRPDQIFVGGTSAGGGLAAAISLLARDKGEVNIAFQMPIYPMLDDRTTESSTDNDAPVWNSSKNVASWKLYLGDLYGSAEIPYYAVPARAEDYSGLPPACIYVGSIEPFFDEAVTYAKNLEKCGIPVFFRAFDGCFHALDRMCPDTDITKEAVSFLMDSFNYAVNNYFAPQNPAAASTGGA